MTTHTIPRTVPLTTSQYPAAKNMPNFEWPSTPGLKPGADPVTTADILHIALHHVNWLGFAPGLPEAAQNHREALRILWQSGIAVGLRRARKVEVL